MGRATSKPETQELRQEEYWSRVTKGDKSPLKGKWKNALSEKQLDGVQEETLAVDKKHNRPLLLQRRRHRLTEECRNYKSVSGCKFGDQCQSRRTEADGHSSKKSKKGG